MKHRYRWGAILVLVVLALGLVSCGQKDAVVGKWSLVLITDKENRYLPEAWNAVGGYIDFDKAKKGILYLDGQEYSFDWQSADEVYEVKLRYESKDVSLRVVVRNGELRLYDIPMYGRAMATFVQNPQEFVRPEDALATYNPDRAGLTLPAKLIDELHATRTDVAGKTFTAVYIYDGGMLEKEDEVRFTVTFDPDGNGELVSADAKDIFDWEINKSGKLELHLASDQTILNGGVVEGTLVIYEANDHSFAMLFSENPDNYVLASPFDTLETSNGGTNTGGEEESNILFYDGWVRVLDQSSPYDDYQGVFVDCWASLEETNDGRYLFTIFEGPGTGENYAPVMDDILLRMYVRIDFEKRELEIVPADHSKGEKNFLFNSDLDQYDEPFVLDAGEGKIHFKKLFVDEDKDYVELEVFLREQGTPWQPGDILPPSMEK